METEKTSIYVYKTPVYVRRAISNYQKKKNDDPEYVAKLKEYKKNYMKNYRLKQKLNKEKSNLI